MLGSFTKLKKKKKKLNTSNFPLYMQDLQALRKTKKEKSLAQL